LGSRIACETAVGVIAADIQHCQAMPDISAESSVNWIRRVREELESKATQQGVALRDLATTMLLAVIGETKNVFVQVGDGAIVVFDGERYRHVFWPQTGEYANTTYFVTDSNVEGHVAFECGDARIDEIAMFTDGLQMLALSFSERQAHGPFFSPMFEVLRASQNADEWIVPMREFLTSSRVEERSDDDKTLILATRIHNNGAVF
jgi:hypothetical protein